MQDEVPELLHRSLPVAACHVDTEVTREVRGPWARRLQTSGFRAEGLMTLRFQAFQAFVICDLAVAILEGG